MEFPTFTACVARPSFGASTESRWDANAKLFVARRFAYKLCIPRVQNNVSKLIICGSLKTNH